MFILYGYFEIFIKGLTPTTTPFIRACTSFLTSNPCTNRI